MPSVQRSACTQRKKALKRISHKGGCTLTKQRLAYLEWLCTQPKLKEKYEEPYPQSDGELQEVCIFVWEGEEDVDG